MSDNKKGPLPDDSAARKAIPMARGLLDYFPAALAEVARVSRIGNEKHNPGEPLHHARGKSNDHADCVVRHIMSRGEFDEITMPDGTIERILHSAEGAWRYLALLQEELEALGAPLARGATLPPEPSAHCEFCPGVDRPHEPDDRLGAGPWPTLLRCAVPGCDNLAVQGGFCDRHKIGSGG